MLFESKIESSLPLMKEKTRRGPVNHYTGKQITKDIILKMKQIAKSRYQHSIYKIYYEDITGIKFLAFYDKTKVKEENLFLGDDWFLNYKITQDKVEILEWIALEVKDSVRQSCEMMQALRQILLQNKEKIFYASMRHDTSYVLYEKMLKRKYFTEYTHNYMQDCAISYKGESILREYRFKNNNEENYIKNFLTENKEFEYYNYILHKISFGVTDDFVTKYRKRKKQSNEK